MDMRKMMLAMRLVLKRFKSAWRTMLEKVMQIIKENILKE
jgi:hypothetical protein